MVFTHIQLLNRLSCPAESPTESVGAPCEVSGLEPVFVSGRDTSNGAGDLPLDLALLPVDHAEIHPRSRIVAFTDPSSPAADRFRYLRMQLQGFQAHAKSRTLLITSPLPGDGKSTTALNLATILAEGGKRKVLLIEADLHQPSLAKTLRISARPGFAECQEEELDPLLAIRRISPLQWFLMQAGKSRNNPAEILQSDRCLTTIKAVASYFDWVVLDAPPVAPLTDAISLARFTDGCLFVVRADRTPKPAIEEAIRLIGENRIIGAVLNGATGVSRLYSRYSRYYRPM